MFHDPARWTAAILAGGAAKRFGGHDKSALLIDGQTILTRQITRAREVASSIVVVTSNPHRDVPGDVQIVGDRVHGMGALGGLFTALSTAQTAWTLALACDMPFVSASFLAYVCALADHEDQDAVIPRSADGLQPLCAAYSSRMFEAVRRQIDARSLKMTDLLSTVRVREIPPSDIDTFEGGDRLFFNINSPQNYRRALELANMQG